MSGQDSADLPAPAPPTRTSALAVTAFVLSLIVFVPLLPLVGGVLGIVAVVRHRPALGGKGLAIAAIPVGVVLFLFQLVPLAIAVPAFLAFEQSAKEAESMQLLSELRSATSLAAMDERVDASGKVLPPAFPRARTDWVPALPCCQHATTPRCTSVDADWGRQPWRALEFKPSAPHLSQVRYQSDGREVTLEARTDVDCDGEYRVQRLVGRITPEGEIEFDLPAMDAD